MNTKKLLIYLVVYISLTIFLAFYINSWVLPLSAALMSCLPVLLLLKRAEKYKLKAQLLDKSLVESSKKLDTLFSNSALGIMITGPDGKLLDANGKFEEMLGYSRDELLSLTFMDLTHPEDRMDDFKQFERAMRENLPYFKEKRYIRKNGDLFFAKLSASFSFNESGEPAYAVAHVEDITSAKRLEDDLKESRKRYRDLLTYSPEPILVHRGGQIIFANEKACKIVDIPMDKIFEKSIYDFIRPDFHNRTRRILSKLHERKGGEETRLFEIVIPNGQALTIEITHKAIEYEGAPAIQAIFRDVTERSILEKELRQANERYKFITENSKDMIAFLAPDGRYRFISSASEATIGFTAGELIGTFAFGHIHEDDKEEVQRHWFSAANTLNDHFDLLYRHKLKNGGFVWLETVAKALRNDKGEMESVLAISRDATKRKEKEESLETANDFLKMLSSLDGLTGIPNRRYFEEALEREWEGHHLLGSPISAIMIDIDCFKSYNDTFGHLSGDDCLKQVASAIRESVKRPRDLAARYGGEEFVVLLPETDSAGALMVADTLRETIKNLGIPHPSSDAADVVTISAGFSSIVPDGHFAAKDLIQQADNALYSAKKSGKNKVGCLNQ